MTGFRHHELAQERFWDPERHAAAIAEFTDGMLTLQQEGVVEGAFVHGRAATHLSGPRPQTDECSDLDVVIIPASKSAEDLAAIRQVATGIYSRHYVELEPWCMTREELESGDHNLEASIKRYMETFFAAQSADNPLGAGIRDMHIRPTEEVKNMYPGEHDLDRYFGYRWDFEQTYLRGVFHDPHNDLDHMLRFPFETGREVVGHLNILGLLPAEYANFWPTRDTVLRVIDEQLSPLDPELGDLYGDILYDGQRFKGLMREVFEGIVSEEEYDQLIRSSLAQAIPKTLEITNRFRQVYRDYCRMHHTARQLGPVAVTLGYRNNLV